MAYQYKQPELLHHIWRTPFYGKAKTCVGDDWWFERDGKRIPLRPANPIAGVHPAWKLNKK